MIGEGKTGPVTREIQKAFHDAIHGKDPRYEHWVDYVNGREVPVSLPQSSTVSAD